jgi:uncharacterized membrane protein YphA (DoxX/SURF4 family)
MSNGDPSEFQRKMLLMFSVFLLVLGIAIFWGWGVMYGTWYPFNRDNVGIYTIYLPLILFGILGILLTRKKPAKA